MKRRLLIFLIVLLTAAMACNLPASEQTEVLPTATLSDAAPTEAVPPSETPEGEEPAFEGTPLSYGWLNLVLPSGVAEGFAGMEFARAEGEDTPPWQITPGHIQVTLTGYAAQEKFHQPQIFVFPAQAYAEMFPNAFESMHRLNNISGSDGPIAPEDLPHIPFFNAGQIFASQIERIGFQNGQGVRFLTEYAQYVAPVNNEDLFYHFQGLTSDGAYYVIVILPVSAPLLPETSELDAVVPPGGVVFPDPTDAEADWEGYYGAVTALLDNTAPDAFSPALSQLDLLVESILIAP